MSKTAREEADHKHLYVKTFLRQMKYLKRNHNILSMDEVIYYIAKKLNFPPNPVAITFDDGFKNNYTVAAPILSELKIPAAFYIPTYFIDTDEMFWVDKIDYCINRTSVKNISLPYFKHPFHLRTKQDKIKSSALIRAYCKANTNAITNRIIDALIDATRVKPETADYEKYSKIKWAQLKEMSNNPLFIIGGHSHTHHILSKLSLQELDFEITESINLLERNLTKKIKHYSYPEGGLQDYNEKVIKKLKANGIRSCLTTIFGLNSKDSNLFELKRIPGVFMNFDFPLS